MNNSYSDILERGKRNIREYSAFLKKIKKKRGKISGHNADELFNMAGNYAFELVDCRECSLCCMKLGPRITEKDIIRINGKGRKNINNFISTYLKEDEDNDLVFKTMPCPFLDGSGLCSIYQDRPRACRDYPHLETGRASRQIEIHIKNLKICPAVVLAVEFLIDFTSS